MEDTPAIDAKKDEASLDLDRSQVTLLLISLLVVALCGIVYELIIGAVSSAPTPGMGSSLEPEIEVTTTRSAPIRAWANPAASAWVREKRWGWKTATRCRPLARAAPSAAATSVG